MAKSLKLRSQSIKTLTAPGMYSDGGGLYLHVTERQRSWTFIFVRAGKRRQMGLGAAADTSLAVARQKAEEARGMLAKGIDPLEARRAGKPRPGIPTFGEMADELIKSKSAVWKDKRGAEMWRQSLSLDRDKKGKLKGHCQSLVNVPVDAVTVDHVLNVLRPIWTAKHVTAGRVRERIELVLDAAKASGHRQGDNPARWRGNLAHLLPKVKHRKAHHAAMAYAEIPAYVAQLRTVTGIRARCLEFAVLTAARTDEAIGATWGEIDLQGRVWVIPADRMKADRDHRVPLSARAVAILEDVGRVRPDGCNGASYVFPGAKPGRPMGPGNLLKLLNETHPEATVHGFRSAFRDWAGDRTSHSREAIEMSLAHAVGDDTEAAYWRSDLLERRRPLMDDWCAYCTGKPTMAATEPAKPGETPPAGLSVLRAFPVGLRPANAA